MNRTINKFIRFSFSTQNTLFTWGQTNYGWGRPLNHPPRVPGLVQDLTNITHVATGPYHMLLNTQHNQTFSAGLGSHGRLGLNSTSTKDTHEIIEQLSGVSIKQLAAGSKHSLALTNAGDVLSWGYGGGCGFISQITKRFDGLSALGHGNSDNYLVPTFIEGLKFPVMQIAAGCNLSVALANSGKVYGWGQNSEYIGGVASSVPRQLKSINYFLEKNHANVVKIRSVDKFLILLLDNGRLYAIGRNNGGVLGTRQNPKIIDDNLLLTLTKIIDDDFKSQKIVNFQVSANSLIFTTDAGEVFYSGMHAKFRPAQFLVQKGVRSIFATLNSVGVIDEEGKVVYLNDQFIDDSDVYGEYIVCEDDNLKSVYEIGGTYKLRYALVQN